MNVDLNTSIAISACYIVSKMAQLELPGFREGMAVETRFTASENPSSMNLQKTDYENIMIHIRVDRDRLVFNTRSNGTWGGEEYFNRSGIGAPGVLVMLRIEARPEHFYVIINGKDNYQYRHRLPYTDVNMCAIGTTDIKYYTVFL